VTEKEAGDGNVVRILRFAKGGYGSLPTEVMVRKLLYPYLAYSGWRVRGDYFGKIVLIMLEGPHNGTLETAMELFAASIGMREKEIQRMDPQEQRKLREKEKEKNESTEFAAISFLNNWSFLYSGSPSGIENQIFSGMVLVEITGGLPENLEKAKTIIQHMAAGLAAAVN
jgi:hypothetical protein